MNRISVFLACILVSLASFAANAEVKYELSGKQYIMKFVKGKWWDGKHSFPNVYCVTFPTPDKAQELRQAMFNNNAIYQVDIPYEDNLFLSVVSSTIPQNQTTEEAMAKVLANERRNEVETKKHGLSYVVSELSTSFGPTVGIVVRNPGPGNSYGPFPLTRSFMGKANSPLLSMSAHRIFARGHDRFEVAAIQVAPKQTTEMTETEIAARLSALADQTVASLQECTASILLRVPNVQP
jgi:hypothetical protein